MYKFITLILLAVCVALANNISTEYVVEKEYHVVKTGQTLWDIAADNIDKQDRTKDIRVFIDIIRDANGIKGTQYIMPGDCLEIPLYKELKK